MKIVIVGDGKVGFTLSQQLAKEGHDIVIIDNNETVLNNSSNTLDVNCIKGNGANYKIQEKAGVQEADLMIAVTSRDELNIICCLIAKKLGAKHTIARVRNPEYSDEMSFIKDELGLSMAVNPEAAAAAEIARILQFPSAIKIDSFSRGKVELAEFKVMPNSPLGGMAIHTL
ncbi:MAG: NAD-binding protein, partial [Clostridia bacterium]